jgi:DNA-3-methyladenine glycosylase
MMQPPSVKDLQPVSSEFLEQKDTVRLARELVGHFLVHWIEGKAVGGKIVETEAYQAPHDPACHAHLNRRTKRTEIMFSKGGHAYIYLCYGIHHLFNIVSGPESYAHAVLIRALEPIWGRDFMDENRKIKSTQNLTNGPGKLTQALGIDRTLNESYLLAQSSPLQLFQPPTPLSADELMVSKRIGIDYAGDAKEWPWRFYEKQSLYVSKRLFGDKSFLRHEAN